MKFIEGDDGCRTLELTRRNITTLLAKLDDPSSARALMAPGGRIMVMATEGWDCRLVDAGPLLHLTVGRNDLEILLSVLDGRQAVSRLYSAEGIVIIPVEDSVHYSDRPPGVVYMPSTEEYL